MDLLKLRKQPSTKINHEKKDDPSVSHINQAEHKHQQQPAQAETKSREKSSVNHKRPSLSHDISSSKRAKGQDTIKTTPQLMQQLMTSTGCNQKIRTKNQTETMTTSSGWSPPMASPQKAQQPVSNSVLMNLLVSGCDVSAGYYTCLPRSKVAKA